MKRQMLREEAEEPERERDKKWYDEYKKESSARKHGKTEVEVMELRASGKKHLEAETAAYRLKESKSRDSELEWLKMAVTRGTESDKIAASIVLIQNNPKYNLARLVSLVSRVKASGNGQSGMLVTSLRDLFLTDLLHPEYKLLKLDEQNLDELDSTSVGPGEDNATRATLKSRRTNLLAHWYFEDQLHEQYERFVTSLSSVASDTVDVNREKAVAVMTDLLIGNSEQEHKLLQFIVNKIGDPRGKVASKAVFCVNKLLLRHPSMKLVVMREIEKLLFRKNVAQRAQYYAICLLAQFILDREADAEVASCLMDVYFAFFKACLKRGEPDGRMMAAILSGVNRTYPFAKIETDKLRTHIDSVYRVVHVGSFNVSLNALSLLHQVIGREPEQENRFYTAFYRKLLDPQIGVAKKRAVFLNLLYRVLDSDKSVTRLYAFIKRIFQVALYFPASMACATLYVISRVLQTRKDLVGIVERGYRTVKLERDVESTSKKSEEESNDSEEERKDARTQSDFIMLPNVRIEAANSEKIDLHASQVAKIDNDSAFYDPYSLNPLKSGAKTRPFAELEALSTHYHPSVALFASTIVQGRSIRYSGDPLQDLNLMRFLDRYVFKNPKKLDERRVSRNNDPLAQRARYIPRGVRSIAVDSEAYVNEPEDRIPIDELFLYRYLRRKSEKGSGPRIKSDADARHDDDNDSVNSEEFNEMLDSLGGQRGFDDLDIAADIGSSRNKNGRKRKANFSDSEDDGGHDGASVESDNESYGGNGDPDEFGDDTSDIDLYGIDDEDLSDMEFNESGEDSDEKRGSLKSKESRISEEKKRKTIKKIGTDSSIFVGAEEFAEMLEKQGRAERKHGGSNAFSDADGASFKQLDWEMERNERITGRKRPTNGNKSIKVKKNVKKFKRRF